MLAGGLIGGREAEWGGAVTASNKTILAVPAFEFSAPDGLDHSDGSLEQRAVSLAN